MIQCTECLWETFSRQLRQFIRGRTANDAVTDDLLQDVFIKIHNRVDTLQDASKIRGWIYQIARNTIFDHYRQQKISYTDLPQAYAFEEEPPVEDSPHTHIAAGLKALAEELPEKYAQAILLTEFQGLSQKELAQHAGISVSGAKSRVQRGRKMMKDLLMQCCHFEFDRYGTIIDFHEATCCCCATTCREEHCES